MVYLRRYFCHMRSFLLIILLTTQIGCSFIVTAAGSFVGNLGADLVEEEIKQRQIEKMMEEDAKKEFMMKNTT